MFFGLNISGAFSSSTPYANERIVIIIFFHMRHVVF